MNTPYYIRVFLRNSNSYFPWQSLNTPSSDEENLYIRKYLPPLPIFESSIVWWRKFLNKELLTSPASLWNLHRPLTRTFSFSNSFYRHCLNLMFFFFPLLQTLAILQQIHLNSIPLLFCFLLWWVFFETKKTWPHSQIFFFGLNIRVTPIFNSDLRYMKWMYTWGGGGFSRV